MYPRSLPKALVRAGLDGLLCDVLQCILNVFRIITEG